MTKPYDYADDTGRWDPDLFGVATQFSGVDGFVFFMNYLDH